MRHSVLFCLLAATAASTLSAATPAWPAFRGPNCSGVATDAKPPVQISPTNSVLWKIQVPWSPSSPCIWGDQLFLTTFADNELQTRCYERGDGKLVWSRGLKADKLEMFHSTESSPAASTPATDGRHLVSYFGSFGLVCYDLHGKELWRYPLPLALSLGGYGTATCPMIAGHLAIVSRDRDDASSLLAVDLRTGKKAWETPRPDSYGSFGTPIVWKNEQVEEIVVPGSLRLKGYALKTGKEDWNIDGVTAFACTTPVTGDGLLFFAAWSDGKADDPWPTWEKFLEEHDKNKDGMVSLGEFDEPSRDYYRGFDVNRDGKIDKSDWNALMASLAKGENVALAIKPGGRGNISQTHVAWKGTRGLPYVASPLLYDGRLYFVKNGGMLSSLDAKTGKPYYLQERLEAPGNYYSSPVAADGKIYLASVTGKLTVVKAGGDKPEILHQSEFGERIYASPALAEDKFYLRTRSTLYAFGSDGSLKP
ncbi:MAG TPA: PQQ-binding-like beta-propeller repeat protein [Candidatus Limnocylindrales bacterium]|nr:PQQ-binding-like beta-propeller repeat protein [Candidatus Limnocylindrales bacterium]